MKHITKITLATLTAVLLTGCMSPTPRTILKNERTGQVASCGGVVSAGLLPYYMQKSSDGDCVADYIAQGFKPVHVDKDANAPGSPE